MPRSPGFAPVREFVPLSAAFARDALGALRITTGCIGSRVFDELVCDQDSDVLERAPPSDVLVEAGVARLASFAPGAPRVVFRRVAERLPVARVPALGALAVVAAVVFVASFSAVAFLLVGLRVTAFSFCVVVFRVTAFFATVFFATAFFAATFLPTARVAVAFLATAFFAPVFLAAAVFEAAFLGDAAAARFAGVVLRVADFLLDALAAKRSVFLHPRRRRARHTPHPRCAGIDLHERRRLRPLLQLSPDGCGQPELGPPSAGPRQKGRGSVGGEPIG